MHFLGSIFDLPLTNLIALTGQIEAHAPQPMHFFSSTIKPPNFSKNIISYQFLKVNKLCRFM